jgi:hypothetical protein
MGATDRFLMLVEIYRLLGDRQDLIETAKFAAAYQRNNLQ